MFVDKKKIGTIQDMAVSLSDAWNDTIITPPVVNESYQGEPRLPVQDVKQPRVNDMLAAKHTKLDIEEENFEFSKPPGDKEKIELMQQLLVEIYQIRKEESKRFTILLVISGILFAVLFMFLDKLQSQIQNLNMQHRRFHLTGRTRQNSLIPFEESYPWLM